MNIVLSEGQEGELPIFQLEPLPGQVLAFGSKPSFDLALSSELRPADFGVTLRAVDLPQKPILEGHVELWGVPADHQVGTEIPRRPLLTLPSVCGPMDFGFHARSWEDEAPLVSAAVETPPIEGCEDLPFNPEIGIQLSNPVADSPTGLRLDLDLPGKEDSGERAEASIEDVTVEMPAGVVVSPGGASGLVACTDAELDLDSPDAARCPPASKVGTVEMSSSTLGGAVDGTLYLGQEHPGDRFRLFVVAPAPGATIKVVTGLGRDFGTGRISTTLAGLPQVPIQHIGMSFDGGSAALLASPLTCGPAPARAKFQPYGGGPEVESRAALTVEPRAPGAPCAAPPFSPQLTIGTTTSRAGRPNVITMTLRREDGEQLPRQFALSLPAGVGAALGAVPACTDASASSGTCPPASRIGSVLAAVGSGTSLATLRGGVFLTGPYRRSPFGLLMEFHAGIGPFDLGSMAVRSALKVNGRSGEVILSSDLLPATVEGLPVRFRTIGIALDRPGLVRNPTSCGLKSVGGVLESQGGTTASVSSSFKVSGCRRLGFKPRFQMTLDARRGLDSPSLRVAARLRRGDSNLRAMKVSFPPVLKLSTSGLRAICSRRDAELGVCPDDSRIGTASARTSLLSGRLTGSIYIVQPRGSGLPDLGVALEAGGLDVSLTGRISSHEGHLVTNLVGLPDLDLSAFTMRLGGGPVGAFSLPNSPCEDGRPRPLVATIAARAQSGALRRLRRPIGIRADCDTADSAHTGVVARGFSSKAR